MDARCDSALRASCGLERLSDGSGWRGYLYPFTPPAPVGSRPAAHARPGHGRRPDQPMLGGSEPDSVTCLALASSNTDSVTHRRSAARLPGRHWVAARGSGRPQCRLRPPLMVRACLRSATLSPLARPRCRLRTPSAQANSVGPSTPTVYDSLTPRRAAGPGAHGVGQGLSVTAAPTSDPYTSVCHRFTGSAAHSSAPALPISVGPRSVKHFSLAGPRSRAPTVSAKG